jgi:hypothetical protein
VNRWFLLVSYKYLFSSYLRCGREHYTCHGICRCILYPYIFSWDCLSLNAGVDLEHEPAPPGHGEGDWEPGSSRRTPQPRRIQGKQLFIYQSMYGTVLPYSFSSDHAAVHPIYTKYREEQGNCSCVVTVNGIFLSLCQCCGSVTFWYWSGSGSADPCLWPVDPPPDPAPDPAIFVLDLQDANKKTIFSPYFFFKVHLQHFLR